MVESRKGIRERIHNIRIKKYESYEPSIEIREVEYNKDDGTLNVFVTPKHRKYIKSMEVTIRDYKLRDRVVKLKKIRDEFRLSYRLDNEKKYSFSFYSIAKDGKFTRMDIDMEKLKENMRIIGIEESHAPEENQSINNVVKEKTLSSMSTGSIFTPVKRSWPTSSQYAQSLQNPNFSLSKNYDELKGITFEKNQNVKYSSIIQGAGNFGVVFKYRSNAGDFALKCFTRGSPNIQLRYYEVSKKINDSQISFLLDFKFYQDALRVTQRPKEYFPAVTMKWIEGKTLHTFIKENLANHETFKAIGNNLVNCITEMQNNFIAHGDLSCDNILIDTGNNVKLIDYDGMFVPALKKLGSEELGHESFQHPRRGKYYGERLDNFSILIIYTSLIALSKNPKLWKYNGDDPDKLLFDITDFESPDRSKALRDVQSESPKLKKLVKLINEYLGQPPDWSGFDPSTLLRMR
ncbi:protein kinase domain-containing protein [Cuniculiplasma divulgatum]|jgi:hypothetical protein|uniref:Serine/threonine protein kinase n=1 Tax=Cuniculiplasma divulgatum TaxID=1673428 RepID=A0A1N5U274_9ARCH|nr:protein kinase family protein [Cuniculiplasma divulgatum]MCL4320505.1 protein kinase family protein [Candidatus Thermoplasmatota archaeon]OWP54587.1 MAG: hypothetical protein B2I18_04850 [Cuniculiplasma sp. C_DKE]WMT48926.1 MAG: protein kinase family protein [Thermoplasmatales archaeon]MCL6014622.1 protein kinase family protein [Candidatus Thermoplasmatota archaeon]SIM54853.1 serine/threonine protein kinase [Cuniculiplasma divulgatum]